MVKKWRNILNINLLQTQLYNIIKTNKNPILETKNYYPKSQIPYLKLIAWVIFKNIKASFCIEYKNPLLHVYNYKINILLEHKYETMYKNLTNYTVGIKI